MIVRALLALTPATRAHPGGTTNATAAYTMQEGDGVIFADTTTAAFAITLLTAVGRTGRRIFIKKTDALARSVTIDAAGSETIDGATTFALISQYHGIEICSNGANWLILSII